jgi:beta-galactosidase
MKTLLIIFFCILSAISLQAQNIMNGTNLFDFGWRFHRGSAQGAENPAFKDSLWRKIDLPHDWGIQDLPGTNSPFNPDAISQVSGGFTTGGTGWYRKSFVIPAEQSKMRILIQFEGIYMNSNIWLNGKNLGNHPYGYTSFWYDITDKIKFGKDNVIAVKVSNEGENSRWYSGSGIYRHVWLTVLDPVHVANWGVSITTPEVTVASAKLNISTTINNKSDGELKVNLISHIVDPKGIEITKTGSVQAIEKDSNFEFKQDFVVQNPELWSDEHPSLYTAVSEVYSSGKLTDRVETKFGIRTITFDVTNGFQLNGKRIKLKGGCVHHDNGPLGAQAYDRAEERRVEILKASGYNAIRCAHNPPSPAFLNACDRLGMFVINEAFDIWKDAKNLYDYHLYFNEWWKEDLESMIIRDRNHPSVILWSIGNEIPNNNTPEVALTAKLMADYARKIDPSRLITSAVPDVSDDKDAYFSAIDVAGYNYAPEKYAYDHGRAPQRVMVATESFPLEAFNSWMGVINNPYVIGDFVWTAFDYIGEASIGWRGYMQEQSFYPWNLAFCGDIDICGWKRPQSFYRDALWKDNQLSVFVKPPQLSFSENPNRLSWSKWHWFDAVDDWNWKGYEDTLLKVNVYSSCETVELYLNNKSLGKKKTNRSTKFMAEWDVPYQAGELKAIGYNGKKSINTALLNTTGEPAQIKISADRTDLKANGEDLSYINVELADSGGMRNPKAENLVRFEIEGPGTIVGVGNANPVSTESYQLPQRKAWKGRCLVIVKSGKKNGNVNLKATADGLTPASIQINIR